MTSVEMHIDFRVKFNKLNSNKNKRFMPEAIDLIINDQMDKFVETHSARSGNIPGEGFEDVQRRLDDIRTVIKEATTNIAKSLTDDILLLELKSFSRGKYIELPTAGDVKYRKLVADYSTTTTVCDTYENEANRLFSSETIPVALKDPFHTSVAESPISELVGNLLRVYENNFTVVDLNIVYVYQYPRIVYNSQDCVLPVHTHREIVDMAVSKVNAMLNIGNYDKYFNEISKNE